MANNNKNKIRSLGADVTAGIVVGISVVLWCFTLAALIFKGELAPFMANGAGFILFGAAVLVLVTALTSSYRATIAAPDEAAGVIISLVAATISTTSLGDATPESVFLTVMVLIVVSTVISALVYLGLGLFKFGDLVRFIPHPVVGGVVVTMGWLLVTGAFNVMTGQDIGVDSLESLFNIGVASTWVPGCLFAIILLVVIQRWNHILALPFMIVAGIAVFYITTIAMGVPTERLRDLNWLMEPLPPASFATFLDPTILSNIQWSRILDAAPSIGSLVLLCVLGLLLSATALEVASRSDIDLNRELISSGIANLLSGMAGGIAGSHSLEESLIAREMHASTRLVGVVTAAVCALGVFYGITLLAYIPRPLLGGVILFFGLVLIHEWLWVGWRRLPKSDYAVVALCLLVSLSGGYLAGVGTGIIAGIMIFVISYSRIDVIKHAVSGADFHSNVERNSEAKRVLANQGSKILILTLQGFIFFGTAHRIYSEIRRRILTRGNTGVAYVILDFRNVSGMDTSTAASFLKMKHLVDQNDIVLALSNMGEEASAQLQKLESLFTGSNPVKVYADSDHALEWCEEDLLGTSSKISPMTRIGLETMLQAVADAETVIEKLTPYFEHRAVPKGTRLIRQGDRSTDLFLIEAGRVTIQLETPGRPPVRLRTMGPGTVVGEVALYLGHPRSASVVADDESLVYRLTSESLELMKQKEPELAAVFNEFIVRVLAGRLVDSNKMLLAVMA